jgi:hypothetical protein
MNGVPGPGALITTNDDPTVRRIDHVVPHPEQPGWWCFLCSRADAPRWRDPLRWRPGQSIVKWYRLEGGRLLGRRFVPGQAGYHAIVGREANGVDYREGPPEVACEVVVVTPARQLPLFP